MRIIVADVKKRIRQAFRKLRGSNLAARMNFSCCGSCGSNEMFEIVKQAGNIGYVFYHDQDNETLSRTGHVLLRFGAVATSGDVAVGQMVVQAMRHAGLSVDWSGDPSECIAVSQIKLEK